MPRVVIPVTEIIRAGVAPPAQTDADATNDHYIAENDGRVLIEIQNTAGSSGTVDIEPNPALSADGLTVAALTITIPATSTRVCGPFRQQTFKQDAVGMLHLNPSVSTTLKFRVYELPAPAQP